MQILSNCHEIISPTLFTLYSITLQFKQLCDAATKYERHVHYQDVHYLTIEHMGTENVIEITDPGLVSGKS